MLGCGRQMTALNFLCHPSKWLFVLFPSCSKTLYIAEENCPPSPSRCSQITSEDYPTEGVCWASVASVQYNGWESPTLVRVPEPSVGRWRIEVHRCWCTLFVAHDFGQLSILSVRNGRSNLGVMLLEIEVQWNKWCLLQIQSQKEWQKD